MTQRILHLAKQLDRTPCEFLPVDRLMNLGSLVYINGLTAGTALRRDGYFVLGGSRRS